MMRNVLLLMIGAATVMSTACASTPASLSQAQIGPSVPPVPPELLAATNGKADPPFQVEAALVLAAQMQRQVEAAAHKTATAPSIVTARVEAPPPTGVALAVSHAQAAPGLLASARSPTRKSPPTSTTTIAAANPLAVHARTIAEMSSVGAPGEDPASLGETPRTPILYADLVRRMASDAPALTASAVPERVQVARAPARVLHARHAASPVSHAAAAARPTVLSSAVRVAFRAAASKKQRVDGPAIVRTSVIGHLRTVITNWLGSLRV